MLSGCVVGSQTLHAKGEYAIELAKKLGYDGSGDERAVLDFLRTIDSVKIIEVQGGLLSGNITEVTSFQLRILRKNIISSAFQFPFVPSIETYVDENTFISQPSCELLRTAWSNDIDIMVGMLPDEGCPFYIEYKNDPSVFFNPQTLVPFDIKTPHDDSSVLKFIERMKESYFDTYEIDMLQPRSPMHDLKKEHFVHARVRSDQTFALPFQRLVQSRVNSGKIGKTFLYQFACDSPTQNNHRNRWGGMESTGVTHAGM